MFSRRNSAWLTMQSVGSFQANSIAMCGKRVDFSNEGRASSCMRGHLLVSAFLICVVLGLPSISPISADSQGKKPLVISGKLDIETFTPICALKFSQCVRFIYSMPVLVVDETIYVLTPEFDASVRNQLVSSTGLQVTIVGHYQPFNVSAMTHVSFCRAYSCASISSLLVFVVHFQNNQDLADLYVLSCRWLPVRCVD